MFAYPGKRLNQLWTLIYINKIMKYKSIGI